MLAERLELPDGDFLDLDWVKAGHRRLAVISHGLEGSSKNRDIRGLSAALNKAGWDTLAWNFRGCSGELNMKYSSFHSGMTEDLEDIIKYVVSLNRYDSIFIKGISLGANILLKYLGEDTCLKH